MNGEGMRKRISLVLVMTCIIIGLVGCQGTKTGTPTYSRSQASTPLSVYSGTVLKVADVQIQDNTSGAGTVIGGVTGGIVGSTIGSGRGRRLATTAGALAGAGAGSAASQAAATKAALELEVELDNGRIMVIVQEKDDVFMVGDRVRIIEARDGSMRVRQ